MFLTIFTSIHPNWEDRKKKQWDNVTSIWVHVYMYMCKYSHGGKLSHPEKADLRPAWRNHGVLKQDRVLLNWTKQLPLHLVTEAVTFTHCDSKVSTCTAGQHDDDSSLVVRNTSGWCGLTLLRVMKCKRSIYYIMILGGVWAARVKCLFWWPQCWHFRSP